jgi:hypothetical protein
LNEWRRWPSLGLLLALFARLLFGALELSRTADEASHIASGYAAVARRQAGLWTVPLRGHPLLIDAWLALPTYIGQPDIPLEGLDGWQSDYPRYVASFDHYFDARRSALFSARVQEMLLTVLLAVAVWRWATEVWGSKAGLLALGVLIFDPTLLAHGRLATNDVGLVMVGTWTLYSAWRWIQRPSWGWALGTGGLMTLTMLAKGSGVLWGAAVGLMMLSSLVRPSAGRSEPVMWRAGLLGQAAAAGVLGLFLLWMSYGFTWGRVDKLPFSLPAPLYWEGLLFHPNVIGDRWVYAMGHRTMGRWWWYFPLTFVIKNPLPLLIGAGVGLGVILIRVRRPRLGVLALFPLLYAVAAVVAGLNVGYRHMLPVHPFLYLAIAGGVTQLAEGWPSRIKGTRRWVRWLPGGGWIALGVWYTAASARIYPYEIAYFNELFGGPEGAYRYLADSNLDWGQATHVKRDYVRANPGVWVDPPMTKFVPEPGQYIVDASSLQGLGIPDPYAYEWFRHWEPEAVIDYSLLVYEVPSLEVGWVAQCDQPRMPLNEVAISEGIGQDARLVEFDCTRTWVYPGGWGKVGLYAVHHDLVAQHSYCLPNQIPCALVLRDPFVARHLAQSRVSFEQEYGNRGVPFVLYELPAGAPERAGVACAVRADVSPAAVQASSCRVTPLALQGPLVFLDAAAYRDGEALEAETWWLVTDGPIARPFALMGHLLSPDGQILGRFDGLGISPLALVAGDVLVQRHRFAAPPEGEAWLRTGVYWGDTMARWEVADTPGADVFLVRLAD